MKRSIIGLASVCALSATGALPAADMPARPDIIVILADDMGFADIGPYGSEIPTPTLDRLAKGGLRFTQFYNCARCCPTRASLLTGLYPHQAGVGHMTDKGKWSSDNFINEWYAGDLRPDTATLAEALKANGYATCMAGKWHVAQDVEGGDKKNWPLQRGFDRWYGIINGAANYVTPKTLVRDDRIITAETDADYKPESYYFTDALGDNAVRFLADHRRRQPDLPLFCYLAFTAPHWPMQAPAAAVEAQRGRYDQGYEAIRQARFRRQQELGLALPGWELSPTVGDWSAVARKDWEARGMEVYAAMVARMDANIGKVVAELERQGRLDRTLILFLSDNGGCAEALGRGPKAPMPGGEKTWISYGEHWANVSNTPFRRYKHFVHEGGIATPLVAHWPQGIARPDRWESTPGHLIDIMATCVAVAGGTYPAERAGRPVQPIEGASLVPLFQGRALDRGKPLFWEHEGNRALRSGDWKLVAKGPRGAWELYDLAKDRSEMHDLAAAQPDRVHALTAEWERWAQRTHAIPWPWGPPHGKPRAIEE